MIRKAERIIVVEKELLIAGYGGTFRHRIEETERGWLRSFLNRARRFVARVARSVSMRR